MRTYTEVFKMKRLIPLQFFIPLIFLCLSIYIILFSCYNRISIDIKLLLIGIALLVYSTYLCTESFFSLCYLIKNLYRPYKKGKYKIIEGEVENLYLVKKLYSNDYDYFNINNIEFFYHCTGFLGHYGRRACDGGFIRKNGQHIKIHYIPLEIDGETENCIVGLFVDSKELNDLKRN